MDTTFAGINRSFCRNASGAILVGSLTDPNSIESTAEWKQQVEEVVAVNDSKIPMILALNKYDLIEEKERNGEQLEDYQVQENLEAFAKETGFIGAVRCSAKTDTNLAELFS
jgi:GTPase SAR1 family protein